MPNQQVVHVVDDDEDVRESAALLLESAGFRVFTYPSGVDFLELANLAAPACILLDIHMPQVDGLEVQRRLRANGVALPVIVLTGQGDIPIAVQAMKDGAYEFLEKPYANEVLLGALESAFLRLEAASEDKAASAEARTLVSRLTGREMEVLRGLLAGLPNKLIAYELDISARTVEVYRAHVMDKLAARSLPAAVRIALAAGVEPLLPSRTH